MSYHERRSLANLVSTLLITILYCAFMARRYPQADAYAPEIFRFWGTFFLLLIPVSIVLKILSLILFTILNAVATREEELPITDERDRSIELRASRNSLWVFVIGFILAMASLAVDVPPAGMFVILVCAGVVSEVVSEISQFYYYRRGF
jgi:uncharacterized membrane protein